MDGTLRSLTVNLFLFSVNLCAYVVLGAGLLWFASPKDVRKLSVLGVRSGERRVSGVFWMVQQVSEELARSQLALLMFRIVGICGGRDGEQRGLHGMVDSTTKT